MLYQYRTSHSKRAIPLADFASHARRPILPSAVSVPGTRDQYRTLHSTRSAKRVRRQCPILLEPDRRQALYTSKSVLIASLNRSGLLMSAPGTA
eukprot:3532810-Rhodomonas_salina.3